MKSNYNKLLKAGRTMATGAIADSIKGLAADPRFAAVFALLENNREAFVYAGSAQGIADSHGKLAHCQGSVYAILTIEGQIREAIAPQPRRKGMERPAEE